MPSAAIPLQLIRRHRPLYLAFLAVAAISLSGCSRLRPKPSEKYLYVTAKSTFLRDRIAAVSNRTGNVSNGQRVLILEQNRRFYRVKTDKGEVGWIDERAIAPGSVADAFDELQKKHSNDPAIANGSVRDDVYLHVAPGRDTDKLFRLDEGEKLHLLQRASTLKPVPPGAAPMRSAPGKNGVVPTKTAEDSKDKAAEGGPEPPAMEDWWLVQDSHNHTGWMLSRMLDVDAPDSIARYAENQRIVGAYILNKVEDPEVEGTDKMIPEYVVVLSPYKAGLPYDFDQLRVFIWNAKRHRYEGAQRDRNIQGFLPVKIHTDPGMGSPGRGIPATGPAPAYTYKVLAAGAPTATPDPKTGMLDPKQVVYKTYRLEGNVTRRVLPPGAGAPAEAPANPVDEKKDKKKAAGKHHR